MKHILIIAFVLAGIQSKAQNEMAEPVQSVPGFSLATAPMPPADKKKKPASPSGRDIRLAPQKWKISNNHLWTGGLVFLAGASKGFNETLHFHWKEFRRQFPKANAEWFNPSVSWRNKYRNNDPEAGPKFFGSTSVLIMFTDQYHLNNFINRAAWGTALVIKLGEGKKPLKHYLLDLLYYSACHQAGFAATYYPFSKYKGK